MLEVPSAAANDSCDLKWSPDCVTITNEFGDYTPPLIDDETKLLFELYVNIVGCIVTSTLGVIGNAINIAVYWRQGMTDSITLGFFALSVSDLILVAMPLCTGSMYAVKYLFQDSPINFPSIHYVSFGWVRNFTYSCSLLITAFLSLERCCCIVLPFKVQTLFTRKKTAVFLFITFLFHAICICLLPAIVQLKWQPSSQSDGNVSSEILRVKFSDFGREMEVFYSTSMSFVVPVGCQVIVTFCAFVMIRGLRKASRFRAQATSTGNTQFEKGRSSSARSKELQKLDCIDSKTTVTSNLHTRPNSDDMKINVNSDKNNGESSSVSTLSQRDARLVRTMVFLVCILSACNVPFLAATFAWRSIPDLNIGRPYENTLSVLFSFVYILGNINASSNIIVYYKTSSRFRDVAKALLYPSKNN